METVIAIGVLAVLLSAFMTVFGPAAAGIRRAISAQEADRLTSTLERELGTLRAGQTGIGITTAFDKAYKWISDANTATSPTDGSVPPGIMLVYQYRGDPNATLRADGTMATYTGTNGIAGTDYIVQPMVRRFDDTTYLPDDIKALEGRIFAVRATQLIFKNGALVVGTPAKIVDPKTGSSSASSTAYPDAVVAFSAEFFSISSTAPGYLTGTTAAFKNAKLKNPIFTRNLAVRR